MVKDPKKQNYPDEIKERRQALSQIKPPYGQTNLLTETDGISSRRPNPLYQQVKDYILTRIKSGEWPPETRVPSENEIVESLRVSRMTVNRALRELTAEGHLVRLQGVGTFVAPQKAQSALMEIRNIADEIRETGGIHSSRVHLLKEESASPYLAEAMELSEGASVFHAILVHCQNGTPIQLADRHVNPTVAPAFLKQDFTARTPSEYLLSIAPITEVEHVIEAMMPDQSTQALLEIDHNEPCLLLFRKTWTRGVVATYNRLIYPGSRYRLGGRFKPPSRFHRITA